MKKNAARHIDREMARAEKALRAAVTLFDGELYEDAVSRAYYAVLHSAKAALATSDVFPDSHQGVRRMFGLHMVKTGLIEPEYAKILTIEQEDRELSDYEVDFEMEKDAADQRIKEAQRFLKRIEQYLADTECYEQG